MDYKNSKIYRIVCNETGETYIGSTTQPLTKRLSKHKTNYKQFLQGKYHFVTSFNILQNNNYDIVLIEEFPCENKSQLHARERYYIESCICVNKFIPSRNIKEYQEKYREENKDKIKEYYEENLEKIKKQQKEYYEKNKKYKKEHQKEYYEKNKDEINRRRREKYHLNKI